MRPGWLACSAGAAGGRFPALLRLVVFLPCFSVELRLCSRLSLNADDEIARALRSSGPSGLVLPLGLRFGRWYSVQPDARPPPC
ncbi:MAG: hypothetical protein QOK04_1674 [Solirubrobacteraceae bacterium]|nr:hypothetical protein [Solirubrobacteraceae bacterium]